MKEVNLSISKENVLKAAKENPCSRNTLECLFPEAFEDNTKYCRIGIVFKRITYPNNFYSIFKWNGEVRILNITHNTFWDSSRNLKVRSLKDPNGEYLTVSEFKKLSGKDNLKEYIILENN